MLKIFLIILVALVIVLLVLNIYKFLIDRSKTLEVIKNTQEKANITSIVDDEFTKGSNSDKCKTLEYSFNDKNIDLGIATITGRYPENGYCVNTVSKELIYVLEGNGKLYLENNFVEFEKGDSFLIDSNEKYYWDSIYCVVSMSCTPAWNEEQYKIVK